MNTVTINEKLSDEMQMKCRFNSHYCNFETKTIFAKEWKYGSVLVYR
jgi:hypothetical protein